MTDLTPRERVAIDLLSRNPGWTNAELGHAMGVTTQVAKNHLIAVFAKYDVPNRAAAVAKHRELARAEGVPPRRRRSPVVEGQLEAIEL